MKPLSRLIVNFPLAKPARPTCAPRAFTLVELLLAMAVLTMIIGLLMQMLNGISVATNGSIAHMDADSQARMVFDRLADDLAALPNRSDVDFSFSKKDGGATGGANDELYFYSVVPGIFGSSVTGPQSLTTLIGYRVDSTAKYQLQRLAKGMLWDRNTAGSAANSLVFLTLSGTRGVFPLSYAPDSQSTLQGNPSWSAITTGSDADYSIFSPGVFRLEFCYYLKDGTYSNKPVITSAGFVNNLAAATAPDSTSDSTAKYSAGSRWYDTIGKRAYICLSADPKAAVWCPLGLSDVSSLVVAIAVLDAPSRRNARDLTQAMEAFPDPTDTDLSAAPPQLMATSWQTVVDNPDFASKAGLPKSVAAQIRIYQRYISISPQ